MIERTPQEEIPEGFFMLGLVLPRVAVIAATLSFLGKISENRLNQSHRNLGPVVTGFHWLHPLSSVERGMPGR
jgi:hypothetical protein